MVARRLVRLVGVKGRGALVDRFRARAEREGTYPARTAYAHLLLATGDAAGAARAFELTLALAPQSLPAIIGGAAALAASGDESGALAAYDRALDLEHRPGPRRRLLEAELALTAGQTDGKTPANLERMVKLRRELSTLDPNPDDAAARLADALELAGKPAEAAAVLEERLRPGRRPAELGLALRAAQLRIAAGDPTETARTMEGLVTLAARLDRRDTERRGQVWKAALEAARQSGMLGELTRRLAALGDAAGAAEWDALGQARDNLGDLDGALAAFRAATAHAPRDAGIAGRVASLLDRLGRDDEASSVYEGLGRRIPGNPRFAIELAERALRRGKRDDALAAIDRAIVRFGRDRGALLELAGLASRAGMEDRSLAAWQRLHQLSPRDEVVIVGLGEAQFQLGHKDEARRTWSMVKEGARSSARGHLRYAEVLLEHDFTAEAIQEARRAQALDSKGAGPHRLLARIFERQRKLDDAVTEWNVVLALAATAPGDEQVGLRREARTHLLGLYVRQGRGRLDTQIRRLAAEGSAHPEDAELSLFLAEAQERAGDANGAAATLRSLLARSVVGGGATGNAGEPHPVPGPKSIGLDTAVEATFGLVRLLKRDGHLDEAVSRLVQLTRTGSAPPAVREAELQIAEIELARYDAGQALVHAARAAPGADGPTLARVADVELRAGDERAALATYRKAVMHDGGPSAAMAFVRLLERHGSAEEAATALDRVLVTSDDDDLVAEAARLATDLGEVRGTLLGLERRLEERLHAHDTPANGRALVTVLRRVVPPLYRDTRGDEARQRLARGALRPILELLTSSEQLPDRAVVELAGMLGNGDAAPAISRLIQTGPGAAVPAPPDALLPRPASREETHKPERLAADSEPVPGFRTGSLSPETRLAAVVALGRLGDGRGAAALERLAATSDTAFRAATIWALGRVGSERALPLLLAAAEDPRPEVAAAAVLGLGRRGGERPHAAVLAAASDPRRAIAVRRAAIVSLGRSPSFRESAALVRLLDSGDDDLALAAAHALAWSRDPNTVPILLVRALLPHRFGLPNPNAPLGGLEDLLRGEGPPDEARTLGARFDLETAITRMLAGEKQRRSEFPSVVRANIPALRAALDEAMGLDVETRREAVAALDGAGQGLALGPLLSEEGATGAPEVARTIREIASWLADRLALLIDDPDDFVRATSLRLLAKLGDGRVTVGRIAAGLGDDSPVVASAAVFAASLVPRDHPGQVSATIAAIAPALEAFSWRHRLAAVDALAALGPAAGPTLEAARLDPSLIVRAAARRSGPALRQ